MMIEGSASCFLCLLHMNCLTSEQEHRKERNVGKGVFFRLWKTFKMDTAQGCFQKRCGLVIALAIWFPNYVLFLSLAYSSLKFCETSLFYDPVWENSNVIAESSSLSGWWPRNALSRISSKSAMPSRFSTWRPSTIPATNRKLGKRVRETGGKSSSTTWHDEITAESQMENNYIMTWEHYLWTFSVSYNWYTVVLLIWYSIQI